ncbi:MAG: glycosyltransferase family 2 protein [Limnohabitans sp.]|jgi:glycosyltransferase involved in cell wall biosynthesis
MSIHENRPPRLSIGILTKNEARLIEGCIQSALFADEVIVLDSGSTDDTVAIAQRLGAKTFVSENWEGFAVQRNRLLAHLKGDFVFFLDADEVITPELRQEIEDIVAHDKQAVWRVMWTVVAYGHTLHHFKSNTSMERLFPRRWIDHYEGVVHEAAILTDPTVRRCTLRHRLLHHSRQSIRASLEKLTQYAMLGAAKRHASGQRGGILRGLASATASFLRTYFIQRGVLDRGAGFLYCLFIALECFFRYVALEYDRNELTDKVKR